MVLVGGFGFSGKIVSSWTLLPIGTHPQFLHLEVHVSGHDPWLSIVYGSPTPHLRKLFWQDLNFSGIDLSKAWLVVGDFNAIVFAEETPNIGNLDSRRSSAFISWISQHQLIDLGFSGPGFTWSRGLSVDTFKGA